MKPPYLQKKKFIKSNFSLQIYIYLKRMFNRLYILYTHTFDRKLKLYNIEI